MLMPIRLGERVKRRKRTEGDAEMREPGTEPAQIGRDALVDRVRGRVLHREDIKRLHYGRRRRGGKPRERGADVRNVD